MLVYFCKVAMSLLISENVFTKRDCRFLKTGSQFVYQFKQHIATT